MKDLTGGKLDESLDYAHRLNDVSLQKCIDRLKAVEEGYREKGVNCETHIITDFAPHSFYFVRQEVGSEAFMGNGGIIFHGSHDRGGDGGFPTFSVNLAPAAGWQIHT